MRKRQIDRSVIQIGAGVSADRVFDRMTPVHAGCVGDIYRDPGSIHSCALQFGVYLSVHARAIDKDPRVVAVHACTFVDRDVVRVLRA